MKKSTNNDADKTTEHHPATTIDPQDFGTDELPISKTKDLEDFACLEACYNCVEDFPVSFRSLVLMFVFLWKLFHSQA